MGDTISILPIPFFAALRDIVLLHSLKRMPKWRMKIAPDLAMQIQPKPTPLLPEILIARGYKQTLLQFDCRAIMVEDVTPDMLEGKKETEKSWWLCRFEIFCDDPGTWKLKFWGGQWNRKAGRDGYNKLQNRVAALIQSGIFDNQEAASMFEPNCLICGKGLTDPISMARRIGPECAGRMSIKDFDTCHASL